MNHLLGRWFTWNIKSYFLWKITISILECHLLQFCLVLYGLTWSNDSTCEKLGSDQTAQTHSMIWDLAFYICLIPFCFRQPYKPLKCQENLHLKMLSVCVVCWIFLQTFQTYFCIQANSVDSDQTAPLGAVWSGSTLFAKMTFKITSRWQSRWQLLCLVF